MLSKAARRLVATALSGIRDGWAVNRGAGNGVRNGPSGVARGGSRALALPFDWELERKMFSFSGRWLVLERLGDVRGMRSSGTPEDERLAGTLDVDALSGVDSVEDTLT